MTTPLAASFRLPAGRPPLRDALGRTASQRLMVISPALAESVHYVGGWLFDHAMAGWVATVLTAEQVGHRPLRILGAWAYDLQDSLDQGPYGRCLQAVAVHAGLYQSQARVRDLVDQARDYELDEILLWGDAPPGGPAKKHGHAGSLRPHHLSAAARVFKAHAVAATRIPPSAPGSPAPAGADGDTEMFRAIAVPRLAPGPQPEADTAAQGGTALAPVPLATQGARVPRRHSPAPTAGPPVRA